MNFFFIIIFIQFIIKIQNLGQMFNRRSNKKRPESTKRIKTHNLNHPQPYYQSNSNIKSQNPHYSTQKCKKQLHLLATVRSIAIIDAYSPQYLKQCILNKKKSYKLFKKADHSCNLNGIYLRSVLKYFREWEEKIYNTLQKLLEEENTFRDLQKSNEIIQQLRVHSLNMKQSLEQLMKAEQEQTRIQNLKHKFDMLSSIITHALTFISSLQLINSELNVYLQNKKGIKARSSQQVDAHVSNIIKKYEASLLESFDFCSKHPDIPLLLKLQFRVRKTLMNQHKKVVHLFKSMQLMQNFEIHFKGIMKALQSDEKFCLSYLENLIIILQNKNKLINQIQQGFWVTDIPQLVEIRRTIEDQQMNFIKAFCLKILLYIRETVLNLKQIHILMLIEHKCKPYFDIKKNILLIINVFQQSQRSLGQTDRHSQWNKIVDNIKNHLSNAIKIISPHIQAILSSLPSLQAPQTKIKDIVLQLDFISQNQYHINSQLIKLYKLNSDSLGQAYIQVATLPNNDYSEISKYEDIALFSNYQLNNQIFVSLGEDLQKENAKDISIDQIMRFYKCFEKQELQFRQFSLIKGLQKRKQLTSIMRSELLIYIFGSDMTSKIIFFYPILQDAINIQAKLITTISKSFLKDLGDVFFPSIEQLQLFRSQINNLIRGLGKHQFKHLINRYIVLLYENTLIKVLNTGVIRDMELMCNRHVGESNKRDIRQDQVYANYILIYEKFLIQNAKEGKYFCQLLKQIYWKAQKACRILSLINAYHQSIHTNLYYPSHQILRQIIETSFAIHLSAAIAQNHRQNFKCLFTNFVKKLSALKQSLKNLNILEQNHQIYQNISKRIILISPFIQLDSSHQSIMINMLIYLQAFQIPHSAIFTLKHEPIWIIVDMLDEHQIETTIGDHLKIDFKRNGQKLVQKFDKVFEIDYMQKKSGQIKWKREVIKVVQNNIDSEQMQMDEQIQQEKYEQQKFQQVINEIEHIKESQVRPTQTNQRYYYYFKLLLVDSLQKIIQYYDYCSNKVKRVTAALSMRKIGSLFQYPKAKQDCLQFLESVISELRRLDIFRQYSDRSIRDQSQKHILMLAEMLRHNNLQKNKIIEILKKLQFTIKNFQNDYCSLSIVSKEGENYELIDLQFISTAKNLRHFRIQQIMQAIWDYVYNFYHRQNGLWSPKKVQKDLNFIISETNSLILAQYKSLQCFVQQHLSSYTLNAQSIKERLRNHLNSTLKNTKFIREIKVNQQNEDFLLDIISSINQDICQLDLIKDYRVLKMENRLLYVFDDQQTIELIIQRCLFISNLPASFYHKPGAIVQLNKADIICCILQKISLTSLNPLLLIKQLIVTIDNNHRQTNIMELIKVRRSVLKDIDAYDTFMALYSSAQLSELREKIRGQINILTALQKLSVVTQKFASNNELQYYENEIISSFFYAKSKDLLQIQGLLIKLKAPYVSVRYRQQIILLAEDDQLANILPMMAISACNFHKITTTKVIKSNKAIQLQIKSLFLTIINIIPALKQTQQHVKQQIQTYLSKTNLQIIHKSKLSTYNCLELLKSANFVIQELEWPKQNFMIRLINLESTKEIQIKSNQYQYFSQISITPLFFFFLQKYKHIQHDIQVLQKSKMAKQREERERQLAYNQDKQKQALQRQVELLRIKNVKYRIQEQNEEMIARLKFKRDYQQERKSLIQENAKNILQEKNRINKQNEQEINQGIKKNLKQSIIKENNTPNQQKQFSIVSIKQKEGRYKQSKVQTKAQQGISANYISLQNHTQAHRLKRTNTKEWLQKQEKYEFDIVLSEGQDEIFNEQNNWIETEIEFEWKLSLCGQIRQAYWKKRSRTIDIDEWRRKTSI